MEALLQEYYGHIICTLNLSANMTNWIENNPISIESLHNMAKYIEETPDVNVHGIIFNYNEEGRLHSKHLGDRYEPAITIPDEYTDYYYLFDGQIKDCIHPFHIVENDKVVYYSTERIKLELPIVINGHELIYNLGDSNCPLIEGYRSGIVESADYLGVNFKLHDYIEGCDDPLLPFKFAD